MKVTSQMSATWPIVSRPASASHAVSAISQPPTIPLAKTCHAPWAEARSPERHRIQRVLGEELLAADDHDDEAERVEEVRDQVGALALAERGSHERDAEAAETHREPGGEAGEGERRARTRHLLAAAFERELEDLGSGRAGYGVGCDSGSLPASGEREIRPSANVETSRLR
jgi:hypothetical protein